jgi:hypothetical protein
MPSVRDQLRRTATPLLSASSPRPGETGEAAVTALRTPSTVTHSDHHALEAPSLRPLPSSVEPAQL